jgi:hypothetical protein
MKKSHLQVELEHHQVQLEHRVTSTSRKKLLQVEKTFHVHVHLCALQTNHERVEVRNPSGWEEKFLKHHLQVEQHQTSS